MKRGAYGFYFVANLTPRVMMFVMLLVLTRIMPMDEYGRLVLVIATGELFDMAIGGWVRLYALRSQSASGTLQPRDSGRAIVLTAITTLLSILGAGAISLIHHDRVLAYAIGAMAYVVSFAPLRLALIFLQVRRMHLSYAVVEMVRSGGTLVAVVAATLIVGPRFVNASLGLAAATAFAALVGLTLALRGGERPIFERTGYIAALVYGLPIMAAVGLNYAIGLFDRYVVDLMIGPHAVAILAAAYSFARQPVELFLGPINTYAFPHLVQTYEKEGAAATGRAQAGLLMTSTMIGGAIAIGLTLLAEPLLTVFLPPDYRREGAAILPWLTVGGWFLIAKVFIFDNIFHLSRETWKLPLAMLPPAVIGAALCILLVPRFGVLGAAVSYAVAGVLFCFASALVAGRMVHTPLPWSGLGRIVVAMATAGYALYGIRGLLSPVGPLVELIGATSAFVVVYAALLSLFGVSFWRLFETPWAPMRSARPRGGLAAAPSPP